MIKKTFISAALGAAAMLSLTSAVADSMRLEWIIQGQFAGPVVALERGYYKEAGIDMELRPAGPDLKPAITVAQGSDQYGIGHPNQLIAARSNGVPLVMVLQIGQRSASTYVVRKSAGINRVQDMPGHSVGLWFGGDEHEFLAMLDAAGVAQDQVKIISQGFDIVGWLNGDYEVMQVTHYNELLQVRDAGFGAADTVLLDPADYGVELISGGVFTSEKQIAENPAAVQAMVDATLRGWQEAFADPEAAARIVLKYNSELDEKHQVAQIRAMRDLSCAGPTLDGRFGYTDIADWETAKKVLLEAKLIESADNLADGFTNAFWEKAPAAYKTIVCSQ